MKYSITTLACALLLAQQANAHHVISDFKLDNMAAASDLVFQGEVVDIAYKGSSGSKGQNSLPHTFVTYAVNDIIYGNAGSENRKKFTLRFMGGPTDNGNFMMVDQLPKFNVGDTDVLFVKNNGVGDCPLVECANGRFRVVDGMVYNEYGQQLVENKSGKLTLGKLENRSEFNTFKIGDQIIKRIKHTSNSKEEGNSEPDQRETSPSTHLDVASFVNSARNTLSQKLPNDQYGKKKVAHHADINKPFSVASLLPARAKNIVAEPKEAITQNKQERGEIEALKKNDGNPVLN